MGRWRAVAGVVAAALVALAPTAGAVPIGQPVPPVPGTRPMMQLQIDELEPRVITSATQSVTVSGRLTNTGDRDIDDISARLQRGEALTSDRELRDVANQATDSGGSPFEDVADRLAPGDSTGLTITVPVAGGEGSLRLTEPGVYPVLVNVNGRPDYGGQARLAAVALPLPVHSLPGGSPAPPRATPPGMTLLWPLLDTQPRRLPTTDGRVVLADDELADSLTVGGRLFGLVNSARTATEASSSLLGSMCFAVDPDLLQTVADMSEGYQVRTSGGQLVAGEGAAAATDWLTRVRDLTRGRCVIAVPYADADLDALSRVGAVDLAQLAVAGSSIVAELLAPVQPAKEIFWPAGGSYDQRTLIDLAGTGPATVLADTTHVQGAAGAAPYAITGIQTANPVRALPIDSLVADALASSTLRTEGGPERPASVQNGLAALTFRAMFDQRGTGDLLIAPPRRWTAPMGELDLFLDLATQLLDGGYASPRPLLDSLAEEAHGTANVLTYTAEDSAQEVPAPVVTEAVGLNATKRDLLGAMDVDNTNNVDPNSLLSPLQYGLLRGSSTAWRGRGDRAGAWVDDVDEQLDVLRKQITVNDPGRPLSLASGDSPIPVTITNGLPVTIVVRINLTPAAGLQPEPYPDVQIPPQSSATHPIPAEVVRAGRFTVDVRLSTPGGTPLGTTTRMELNSTSYGIITVAVTGTAAGVLVLLTVVRIFRRVKGARAGAPGDGKDCVDA